MTETIGGLTVDTAEGLLLPPLGLIKISIDPAPPVYSAALAVGVGSPIFTSRAFATVALALAEAAVYRSYVGVLATFRGQLCFVADCVPDHRAAKAEGDGGVLLGQWTLVSPLSWVP